MADIYTDIGESFTADLFDGTTTAPANHYVAWGTGAGTTTKTDTTLFTEGPEARVAVARSQPTSNQNRFVGTIVATGARTVTNAGIWTDVTGGNLLLKSDFTGVVLASGDAIQFTFTLTWA